MDTRTKTFHYKSAQVENGSGDLQTVLSGAFRRANQIKLRQQPLNPDSTQVRFLALQRSTKGILFGVAVTYTKGNNQAVVPIDDNAAEVALEQVAPPANQEGKRTEFVEGTAFFAVKQNHVIVLQSTSFRATQLEEYFNWLLRRGVPREVAPVQIVLADKPRRDLKARAVKGVKSIIVRAPVEFEVQTPPPQEGKQKSKSIVLKPKGIGYELLESAMDTLNKTFSDGFRFKDALDNGDVEVRLQVIYKKRKKDEHATMLDDIAAALSHVDVDYDLDVPGYGTIGSELLRIQEDFSVDAPGGLPLFESVIKRMTEWLESLLSSGMV